MTLYQSLAPVYDHLFPIDPRAAAFLDALVTSASRPAYPRLLDAGCATGGHALALAALGWKATGIDSEAVMIAAARESAGRAGDLGERASFFEADMLGIAKEFRGESFDLILCLGNTLPHLIGQGALDFLGQARSLIAPGGALVLQTLNFSLPRIAPGFSFPELSGA